MATVAVPVKVPLPSPLRSTRPPAKAADFTYAPFSELLTVMTTLSPGRPKSVDSWRVAGAGVGFGFGEPALTVSWAVAWSLVPSGAEPVRATP
ncbi:hypothetical protein VR44_15500 [Streptomyces katrae]|uniref:Uncharacterized protein n=1 Tax=Streptomyces katrae TaxID=68223 RepID=A0A0F4JI57_9ACTN|nr:hypothetical protein VR44_15500 [Streptomyces katrae]